MNSAYTVNRTDGYIETTAAAKVNLFLEILGRRDNGYHDIRSVLVPVSLCDKISLERTDGDISLTMKLLNESCSGALADEDPRQNLVIRAAELLKEKSGTPFGVKISLVKEIPVGGGLGGGSADAAAVLNGLNELWDLGLDFGALCEIAASLGCDIPALLHGGAVLMEGLGEIVSPFDMPAWGESTVSGDESDAGWLVIVNPGISVSTADIYKRCRSTLTSGPITFNSIASAFQIGDPCLVADNLFNGLQETVFRKYPLIEMVAERLKKAGALGTLVSGSGASVFGIARNEDHAKEIEKRVRDDADIELWVSAARILPDSVMAAHGPLTAIV